MSYDISSAFVTPTTELEAVNFLLSTIGQAPVSTLEADDGAALGIDTEKAIQLLSRLNRSVQTEGWHFNEEKDYPFQLGEGGTISIPDTILHFTASKARYGGYFPLTRRDGLLYNMRDRTTVFTDTVYLDVRWLMPFEDLPESVRQYLAIKAARQFSDQEMVSETSHKFTREDETRARVTMESTDAEASQHNTVRDNPHFREMMRTGRSSTRWHL